MRKVIETKEDDFGIWEKVVYDNNSEAVWIKKDDFKKELRMPISCKVCNKFMMNWDTKFFYSSGVCADCHINYIEGKESEMTTIAERVEYCKKMIQEKQDKNIKHNS